MTATTGPAEAKNEDEQVEETRTQTRVARWEQQFSVACESVQPLSQTKYRWTHRTEKSARTTSKDQGACKLSSQDQRTSREAHKSSATTAVATERCEKRHKGNDIGMVNDTVTVPCGQHVHTMLVQFEAAKMTRKTEQDSVVKALAEKDPDTMVTLSATVSEQEADTRADVEELTRFVMRTCQNQIPCNMYSAHVWPRWSKVSSVPEVSRLMHMRKVQIVESDMCRFGHPHKGPMKILTNSLQVAQKANRRYPSRRQHPVKETDMQLQDSAGWAAVLCKVTHASTTLIAYLMGDEYF